MDTCKLGMLAALLFYASSTSTVRQNREYFEKLCSKIPKFVYLLALPSVIALGLIGFTVINDPTKNQSIVNMVLLTIQIAIFLYLTVGLSLCLSYEHWYGGRFGVEVILMRSLSHVLAGVTLGLFGDSVLKTIALL